MPPTPFPQAPVMTLPLGTPLPVFVGTRPLPCPYLPGQVERKTVIRLPAAHADRLHSDLVRAGFRRSHGMAYRPACPTCSECRPVRIDTREFRADRRFRRARRLDRSLTWHEGAPVATREQYGLFRRYQADRHIGGGMEGMDYASYQAMVEDTPVATRVVEARDRDRTLVAVALTDRLADGLSGIYKFWAPERRRDSPGTATILWHIRRVRSLELRYFYLGYWIPRSAKMAYKRRFRPLEELTRQGWVRLDAADS